MPEEEFEFIERFLREKWAQEGTMNEHDQEEAIRNLKCLLEVVEDV